MSVQKRRWWQNIYLEFYFDIPFLTIQTRLLREAVERMSYDICRVRIKLWKWSWDFQLYKRPDMYAVGEVSKKPNRVKSWLKRKLTHPKDNTNVGDTE